MPNQQRRSRRIRGLHLSPLDHRPRPTHICRVGTVTGRSVSRCTTSIAKRVCRLAGVAWRHRIPSEGEIRCLKPTVTNERRGAHPGSTRPESAGDAVSIRRARRRATEIERSGSREGLEKAARRLRDSGKPQRVLQVPQKDMSKATAAMRKTRTSGTVKNMRQVEAPLSLSRKVVDERSVYPFARLRLCIC